VNREEKRLWVSRRWEWQWSERDHDQPRRSRW